MTIMRYKNRGTRYADRKLHEKASEFSLTDQLVPLNGTGDILIGAVRNDCKFLGGIVLVSADEGTNGDLTVEKWDSAMGGSYKTAITGTIDIDAGAAANEPIAALATGVEYLTAGDIVVVNLGTGTGNAVTGDFTLYFKNIEFVGVN